MIKRGIYLHFKGKKYEVLDEVKHSETLEEFVLYKALYGERKLWIRPLKMFLESVIYNNIKQPRFKWIKD